MQKVKGHIFHTFGNATTTNDMIFMEKEFEPTTLFDLDFHYNFIDNIYFGNNNIFFQTNNQSTIFGYGNNDRGQLGVGDFQKREIPTKLFISKYNDNNERLLLQPNEKIINIYCNTDATTFLSNYGNLYYSGSRKNKIFKLEIPEQFIQVDMTNSFLIGITKSFKIYSMSLGNSYNFKYLGFKMEDIKQIDKNDYPIKLFNGGFIVTNLGKVLQKMSQYYFLEYNLPFKPLNIYYFNANEKQYSIFFLLENYDIYVLGDNTYGQLGLNDKCKELTKLEYQFDSPVISIIGTFGFTIFQTKDSNFYCCGKKNDLFLTNKETMCLMQPTLIENIKLKFKNEIRKLGEEYIFTIEL
ncbi:hypothetical protein ABK040_011940 [Willaertia magna]